MTALDSVLDLLDERLEAKGDPGVDVHLIVSAVDHLLSRVLLFRTIVLSEDQGKVFALCRSVLEQKLRVEQQQQQGLDWNLLSVEGLRLSVVQLEVLLNNCTLRLFIDTMVQLQENPLESLLRGKEIGDRPAIEEEFDLLHDRLIELGVIASGFTESASGGNISSSSSFAAL